MPPQQPYTPPPAQPTPPTPNNGQYDFIMSPGQPGKRSLMPSGLLPGGKMKMLIIGLVVLTAIVFLLVIITSLSSGGGVNKVPFVKAAQQQAEIIRVSQTQYSKVTDPDVQNFVINTQLSLTTDQQTLNDLLGKLRVKVSAKELQLGANKATDETLASAVASSTLNTALTQELQNELEQYQNSLKLAYNSVTGPKTRQTIQQLYDHAGLLIEQSKE